MPTEASSAGNGFLFPSLNNFSVFRYSVACIAVCTAAPALGVTHWSFALDSLPLNVYLTYLAYKFYRDADRDSTAGLLWQSYLRRNCMSMDHLCFYPLCYHIGNVF